MTTSRVSRGLGRSLAAFVFAAGTALSLTSIGIAAPVLQVSGTSLTNYLPATASAGQGVWPRHAQRGVGIDGSLRSGSPQGFSISANPSAESWNAKMMVGSVRVDLGTPVISDIDLSFPTVGPSWTIGRTFNSAQRNGSTHIDSDGYQGKNWFQSSNPEIVFYDTADTSNDVIYVVYGADRYIEFRRSAADANVFTGRNGAAGVVQYAAGTGGEPDTWTYIDGTGNRAVFFGGNTASGAADWQLWKLKDVAGNVAYIGDATTASTAVTNGYSGKRPQVAYDAAGRRFTYTYTAIDSVQRLTQVKAETKTGGTWASPTGVSTVGQVDYAYYTGSDANGDNGNLKTAAITLPQSDASVTVTTKKYYRYYTGSYNSSTNPGQANALKLILGTDGTRAYDYAGDSTFNDSFLSASTDNLKSYSDAYFEYENTTAYQVNKAFFNGQCGCGGGVNGQYTFALGLGTSYTSNTGDTTYQSANALRSVIQRPDGTWETRYFEETHQPTGWAVTNSDPAASPTQTWASNVARDSSGRITSVKMPSNVTAYSHSLQDFTDSSSSGLTSTINLVAGGTDLDGISSARRINPAGTGSGTDYVRSSTEWTSASLTVGSETLKRPLATASWTYTQDTTSTATVGGGSNPSGAYSTYAYLGSGQVVGTDLPEPNLNSRLYASGTANYANVDRFGRIVTNKWEDTASAVDLYNVAISYDRDSNITSVADAVNPGFDALYSMDSLNRLIKADEGTLSSGSISDRKRQELWTLTQTGNWSNHKLDLNGDSSYTGTNELNDTGTFNTVNELTARDKDSNSTNDYTLAYDAVGNMTDDGEKYTYVYDAFGRLVTVKNRSTSAVVAEYKYNGLNQRIGSHDDTDASGTVDSSDPWYWYVQDDRWRTVATFRASAWGYSGSNDTSPKETTVYHAAGLGGLGGSSYIDGVILADKDMTNGWGGAADGTREKRVYLLQNWRADVSCVTDQNGKILEWIKYSPYGVPYRIDPADYNRDGVVDSSDSSAFTTEYNNGGPRSDANHDGFIDFTDYDLYSDNYTAASAGGRNVLSRGGSTSNGIHNRIGYAGYLWDSATSQYHVRNRVFLPSLGRWNRRDPIGYVDGLSLYEYVQDMPINAVDPQGLKLASAGGTGFFGEPTTRSPADRWFPKPTRAFPSPRPFSPSPDDDSSPKEQSESCYPKLVYGKPWQAGKSGPFSAGDSRFTGVYGSGTASNSSIKFFGVTGAQYHGWLGMYPIVVSTGPSLSISCENKSQTGGKPTLHVREPSSQIAGSFASNDAGFLVLGFAFSTRFIDGDSAGVITASVRASFYPDAKSGTVGVGGTFLLRKGVEVGVNGSLNWGGSGLPGGVLDSGGMMVGEWTYRCECK